MCVELLLCTLGGERVNYILYTTDSCFYRTDSCFYIYEGALIIRAYFFSVLNFGGERSSHISRTFFY